MYSGVQRMQNRRYQLKRRAERADETKRRIVEATVALHTTVGPARTSISAIADRAGVQRHTVYAHFPDDNALFEACTGHWRAMHPFPPAERWFAIGDPARRLRRALRDVYAWYGENQEALVLFVRDGEVYPEFAASEAAKLRALADALAAGFGRRRTVGAAVGHALAFETWRSRARREGLSNERAADLMVELARCAAA
jgi:AcrR family transcriptional regulator